MQIICSHPAPSNLVYICWHVILTKILTDVHYCAAHGILIACLSELVDKYISMISKH